MASQPELYHSGPLHSAVIAAMDYMPILPSTFVTTASRLDAGKGLPYHEPVSDTVTFNPVAQADPGPGQGVRK